VSQGLADKDCISRRTFLKRLMEATKESPPFPAEIEGYELATCLHAPCNFSRQLAAN
jgi:hypothetical protein